MNNFIGPIKAEWVDPAVELPPEDEWVQTEVIYHDGATEAMMNFIRRGLWNESGDLFDAGLVSVVRWLRLGGADDAADIAKFIRNGGCPQDATVTPMDMRAPEPEAVEKCRNELIVEMADHGMHPEDAAATVDGLIGACQRDAIPRAAVQAAVDEMYASEATNKRHIHESDYARGYTECAYDYRNCLRQYSGITPKEGESCQQSKK